MVEFPLEEDVPLAERTTLGVGGPARYLARCKPDELRTAFAFARQRGCPTFVLGGGSNLLVADRGFDGLVAVVDDTGLKIDDPTNHVIGVRVGAGVDWDHLVATTVAENLAGLECLSGIPGRVGAAPIQNIGAYGQEVAETIARVHVVERSSGRASSVAGEDCSFAYRWSRFKGEWRDRYAVVGVDFRLERRTTGTLRYADLRRRFGKASESAPVPIEDIRQAVLEIRRSKSMVLDPDDPNRRSAGSFFVNPVVTPERAEEARLRLGATEMPSYPAADGQVKLSAAWLIERCGFDRGYRMGRAGISTRHCLALVNTGGATAEEIVALARRVRNGVREATGVVLDPEPVFLGFEAGVDVLL